MCCIVIITVTDEARMLLSIVQPARATWTVVFAPNQYDRA